MARERKKRAIPDHAVGKPIPEKSVVLLRRGKRAPVLAPGTSQSQADRQFVVALARGLEVLGAFRLKDASLGNGDLAERTGIHAATISRFTHTLTRMGYLTFDPRRETYDLGPMALSLGFVALRRLNIRDAARPLMQKLADEGNFNVGLGIRERRSMLYVEACEGQGPIGLKLVAGSRMPITTSAMGRAYAAALSEESRAELYDELRHECGGEWPTVKAGLEDARLEIAARGFCTSIGAWQKEINGAAVPLTLPESGGIYVMNVGGPAYQLSAKDLAKVYGPKLVATVTELRAIMAPQR
jgi:DNA-binding IclR family transcriptional regulator